MCFFFMLRELTVLTRAKLTARAGGEIGGSPRRGLQEFQTRVASPSAGAARLGAGGSQTFHVALVRAELSSIPKQKPRLHWDLQTRNSPSPVIQPLSDFCPESRYVRHLNRCCTAEVSLADLTVCHPLSAVDPYMNSVAQLSAHCPIQGQVIFIHTSAYLNRKALSSLILSTKANPKDLGQNALP